MGALESQEHQLKCGKLSGVRSLVENNEGRVTYCDMFSDTIAQKHITVMFTKIHQTREEMLLKISRTAIE